MLPRQSRHLRAAGQAPPPKPPEASAEELQARLDELREIARERPDASIYLSVKNGRARVAFPGGSFEIVGEGEALRIWPSYCYRGEPDAR